MRVTAETKQATRKAILEASQKLFAQQGFDGATTRDIARAAGIGVGTLFNYFPTKEAIALALVGDAWLRAAETFAATQETECSDDSPPPTLEEDLFAHVAAILRRLKPYRKYLPAVLESSLSPAADQSNGDSPSLRAAHLEIVGQILSRHGHEAGGSPLALQLYWTLYTGVLAFWAADASPRQEDTLALLDESLTMFALWLTAPVGQVSNLSSNSPSQRTTFTATNRSEQHTPKNRG